MLNRMVDLPPSVRRLFFIGIGGVSMTSLALISQSCGYEVSGSDAREGKNVALLRSAGIPVCIGHDAKNVDFADMVVYTAAVGEENPERKAALEKGIPCVCRAVFLGGILSRYKTKIGVCGMHGKSTSTSMLSHLYLSAGLDPTIIGGAEISEISSAYRIGSEERVIFESDEYKASFHSFPTDIAVCLNADLDHVDFYPDIDAVIDSFRVYMHASPCVVRNADDPFLRKAAEGYSGREITFSLTDPGADLFAADIAFSPRTTSFDLMKKGEKVSRVEIPFCGRHFALDMLAALAAFDADGQDIVRGAKSASTFQGTKRRAEYRGKTASGALVFDDYAHHPTEIRASLSGFREAGGKIFCVFQPHTYSRTLALKNDFASALSAADEVIYADVFAAREKDVFGISSRDLAKITKNACWFPDFPSIAAYVNEKAGEGDVILTMGAGDINKVGKMILDMDAARIELIRKTKEREYKKIED